MLRSCATEGVGCALRTFLIILVWSLMMIVAVHFYHYNQFHLVFNSFGADKPSKPLLSEPEISLTQVQASRFSLQRAASSRHQEYPILATTDSAISLDLEPLLDKTPIKSENELLQEVKKQLPSLFLNDWTGNSNLDQQPTSKANKFTNATKYQPIYPSIFELEYNNVYWQTLRSTNGTFQLFGAFYDERKLLGSGRAIRILGMIDRIEPTVKTYCHMWFKGETEPRIVDVLEYKYIWRNDWENQRLPGIYHPYLITCNVPRTHRHSGPPASVSLVEKRPATNSLRITYNKPAVKKDFAVCVKGLDLLYEDLSVRLVEWIELITLLGADKIFFYKLQVHPNITKVLQYYQRLGKVHVTPLTLPGGQPNVPAIQHLYLRKQIYRAYENELIPYNDCLYKHMYEYEYIALLDVDEVIIPKQDYTWQELMARVMPKAFKIMNETSASYNVRNVYFFDDYLHSPEPFKDIPKYMHMLQYVYRSKNFTEPGMYVKSFHNPERVITVHNHFPLACFGASCTTYPINTEDAQMQHYRADCVDSLKNICWKYRENLFFDTTIWRYRDKLVAQVTSTLRTLGFFRSNS